MPNRAVEDVSDLPNWSLYTVPQLKVELGVRGLSKSSRKADLIARL